MSDQVEIKKLVEILSEAITGKEPDRDEKRRVRSRISHAIKKGDLIQTTDKTINWDDAVAWMRNQEYFTDHWRKISKHIEIPPIESTDGNLSAQASSIQAGGTVIPGDIDQLKSAYVACHHELRNAKSQIASLRNQLDLITKENVILNQKENNRKAASRKGGLKSKGKSKNYK